uniref:Thymidine phosphorylase n=1 Tax=Callorhinchus milii TaxID=7868 RepID=V9KGQ0_CALMI
MLKKADLQLSFPEVIRKKRDQEVLTAEEIHYFVQGVKEKTISDSQIGAVLMAIRLMGMNEDETLSLTREMMSSGKVLQWPEEWQGTMVDKHSTGGVGDKVSLPLAPALAACGCKVPMISGRGLGHTGGTLDKLESIPGFTINLNPEEVLAEVGCCIVGQSASLVPVDRILYAIRDVTGTVDSNALIAASILAKKGAESLSALVLDVKHGAAAIYTDLKKARLFAHTLVKLGERLGVRTVAVLTAMDSPIGRNVGNSLEVIEAVECLRGRGDPDLEELVTYLGGYLLSMCGKARSSQEGAGKIAEVLRDGTALAQFQAMLVAQGVGAENAKRLCQGDQHVLPQARHQQLLRVPTTGTVQGIRALPLAEVVHELGAGRTVPGEAINHSVGIELLCRVGQDVRAGEAWLRVHYETPELSDSQLSRLQGALSISDCPVTISSRVTEVITFNTPSLP